MIQINTQQKWQYQGGKLRSTKDLCGLTIHSSEAYFPLCAVYLQRCLGIVVPPGGLGPLSLTQWKRQHTGQN